MADTEKSSVRLIGARAVQAKCREEVARLKAGGHAGPQRNRMIMTPPAAPPHPAGTIVIRGTPTKNE